jgi:RNA polymerase subunit RPABC4/transcription elongation factor Spt4
MFFLIGGISPREVILDDQPRLCPVCGLAQARYRRIDHYLNLFFIPLFPVKKGEPFLMCDRCERAVEEMGPEYRQAAGGTETCGRCGRELEPDFRYCPGCGARVSR